MLSPGLYTQLAARLRCEGMSEVEPLFALVRDLFVTDVTVFS